MTKYLVFLMLCVACKPTEPEQGFGLEQVTDNGLVDTNGDGAGDVEVETWCPAPVLDYPDQAYSAEQHIADAVGFHSSWIFRLEDNGDIGLCLAGEAKERPIWWACNDGSVDVYGGGFLAVAATSKGLLATVDFLDYVNSGVEVRVTGAKNGDSTTGIIWFEDSCN